jgi:hypothetical protein
VLAAALLLAAAPAAGPQAFVEAIYARWRAEQRRGNGRYQPPRDGRVFAPELAALYARDAALSARTGEMGEVDAVPLCACQDDEGVAATTTLVRADARAATVRVRLSFGRSAGPVLTLRLVRLAAGWRIADIEDEGGSTLRRLHAALDGRR